jgi:hydroxyacylglutathione hydrolase
VITVHQFCCLADNYGYLLHDDESDETVCVDTPDAEAILAQADARGWRITQVWNTHWHFDHMGGNAAVKAATGATLVGPEEIARHGGACDRVVVEGDRLSLGRHRVRVMAVGGHTLGHVAYVFDEEGEVPRAFVGDALFALGCGRMFEGTPEGFWESLMKLAALPDDTWVYCAHEYTQANARFACAVDSGNEALRARVREVEALRAAGRPTVPSRMGDERATNPFLRAPVLAASLGMVGAPDHAVFAELRRRKDVFR